MFFLLGFLPFGGALLVRLRYQRPISWLIYGALSLIHFLLTWLVYSFDLASAGLVVGSIIGFLGPDLWLGLRNFVHQSRVIHRILGILLMVILYCYMGFVLTFLLSTLFLLLVIAGLLIIIRPILPTRFFQHR